MLLHRDLEKLKIFFPQSGFLAGYQFQGCTRLAVKLDFMVGVIAKALRAAGSDEFRGNQAMLGEVIAWRNLFWALTDAMAMNPTPWVDGAVLPNAQSGSSYRVFAGDAYGRIKEIVEKIVASSLIYLPSSAKDFKNPEIDQLSRANMCAAPTASTTSERIKVMKLLWDAIGTEFGGRHELYETQLRRQPRGHPHPGAVERARLGHAGPDDRRSPSNACPNTTRTAGPIRHLARSRRCRLSGPARGARGGVGRAHDVICPAGLPHELDRPTARRCHGRRLHGGGAGAAIAASMPAAFREAMSRLGAAVHVVTTGGPGRQDRIYRDRGVLGVGCSRRRCWCASTAAAKSAPLLAENGVFCVNTLGADEEKLADLFAGRTGVHLEERFNPSANGSR